MNARITLTATAGPLRGREFTFTGRTLCTVGRADGCLLRIRGDDVDPTVSRRHCLLDIEPPAVRVRDLGSLNGTFLNGRCIGGREKDTPPPDGVTAGPDGSELHDGDRLAVGVSEFLVRVRCDQDGAGRPPEDGVPARC